MPDTIKTGFPAYHSAMTRRHFFLIALIPFLIFGIWHYLSPTRQLKSCQRRLLEAISQKDAAACARLIHPDYTDQWNFTAADWPEILLDLRKLSPILEINLLNPTFHSANGVVETSLQIKSTGGPASEIIAARAVELKETSRFLWKRELWRPWSWRLVSVQNPALDLPAGYRPGRIGGDPPF
jgi:hypothetical protein